MTSKNSRRLKSLEDHLLPEQPSEPVIIQIVYVSPIPVRPLAQERRSSLLHAGLFHCIRSEPER